MTRIDFTFGCERGIETFTSGQQVDICPLQTSWDKCTAANCGWCMSSKRCMRPSMAANPRSCAPFTHNQNQTILVTGSNPSTTKTPASQSTTNPKPENPNVKTEPKKPENPTLKQTPSISSTATCAQLKKDPAYPNRDIDGLHLVSEIGTNPTFRLPVAGSWNRSSCSPAECSKFKLEWLPDERYVQQTLRFRLVKNPGYNCGECSAKGPTSTGKFDPSYCLIASQFDRVILDVPLNCPCTKAHKWYGKAILSDILSIINNTNVFPMMKDERKKELRNSGGQVDCIVEILPDKITMRIWFSDGGVRSVFLNYLNGHPNPVVDFRIPLDTNVLPKELAGCMGAIRGGDACQRDPKGPACLYVLGYVEDSDHQHMIAMKGSMATSSAST